MDVRYHGAPVVIVVDDDPDVLGSLTFALEVEGFEVHAYPDAASVLAGGVLPERGCLVLDQHMPSVTGLTLLSRLRERGCRLPAIMITTPNASLQKLAAAMGVAIVEKPLLCDTLVSKVCALLDAAAPIDERADLSRRRLPL